MLWLAAWVRVFAIFRFLGKLEVPRETWGFMENLRILWKLEVSLETWGILGNLRILGKLEASWETWGFLGNLRLLGKLEDSWETWGFLGNLSFFLETWDFLGNFEASGQTPKLERFDRQVLTGFKFLTRPEVYKDLTSGLFAIVRQNLFRIYPAAAAFPS